MKVLAVAHKSLREIGRELQLLGLTVALPLIFMLITKATYGGMLVTTHPVLVLPASAAGEPLVAALQAEQYADGRPVFALTPATDQATAEEALKAQRVTAVVTVAADGQHATITGDATASRFYRASVLLNAALNRYADRAAGRPEIVRAVEQPLTAAAPQSDFDLYAPGMMIFALLMIVPQTAMLVAREVRWRTLRRLQLTQVTALEWLGGISLAQLIVAVAQVAVLFGAALALGFHNHGSLPLAVLVGLVLAGACIGQGLVTACFVENDSQAANIGSTVAMLQVFVSGAFFAMPPLTVFTLGGHQIDLFDLSPATSGLLALQQVLGYGAGLREIGFRLGVTAILSVAYFALGVIIFRRKQLRAG